MLQAVETIVAGILHDVVDDTCQSLQDIEAEFGDDVAELVAGVSRLSYINQVSRRQKQISNTVCIMVAKLWLTHKSL